MALKAAKQETLWRVAPGRLEPFDAMTVQQLRENGYRTGDVLAASLKKSRSPEFNGLAHKLGSLLAENIDAFDGMDAHAVLKRLQIEGDIACDHLAIKVQGLGMVEQRIPRSLSYHSMDEGEFRRTVTAFCKYVSRAYWPTCKPEEIERMAELWVEAP